MKKNFQAKLCSCMRLFADVFNYNCLMSCISMKVIYLKIIPNTFKKVSIKTLNIKN